MTKHATEKVMNSLDPSRDSTAPHRVPLALGAHARRRQIFLIYFAPKTFTLRNDVIAWCGR